MRNHCLKKGIPLLFLLLFLGVNASAFHAFTHNDCHESEHCEICVLVYQQDLEDFDFPQVHTVPDEQVIPVEQKERVTYFSVPYIRETWMRHFSRPPPQLA